MRKEGEGERGEGERGEGWERGEGDGGEPSRVFKKEGVEMKRAKLFLFSSFFSF